MEVLELYAGIGGMSLAMQESGVKGKIIAAMEINPIANKIYQHNFPETKLYNLNICGLTSDFINQLGTNTILMSPPCQPFTRNGLQNDINDPRTDSFLHILNLLPHINIKQILIENVKGFETSHMRKILINTLERNNFTFQEFILSPHQLGIPNSRFRYYCLAKKQPKTFSFITGPLMENFPHISDNQLCFPISDILENQVDQKYYLSESILKKRANILDICYKQSRRTCCFTKAYSRFIEGTGSVYTDKTESDVSEVFGKVIVLSDDNSKVSLLKTLNLRFFTPKEVCRFMSFPEHFSFPCDISDKSKYMVLGNSINIKIVAELIKLLNMYNSIFFMFLNNNNTI